MEPTEPKSSGTTKKWLIGCGVGCGVIIVLVVILIIGGVIFVKNLVKGFEESEELMNNLVERYGEVSEYCPEPHGSIPAARLEAFIRVREASDPIRREIEDTIRMLSDKTGGEGEDRRPSGVIGKIRAGVGMVPKIADWLKVRNQALLDQEMGPGEYSYLMIIVYFSWLEKPLIDGSAFDVFRGNEGGGFQYRWDEEEESEEVRTDFALRRLRRIVLPMLKNQAEKLAAVSLDEAGQKWRTALEEEIAALEDDRYRLVYEDGLPEAIKSSLEPFRSRLAALYSPLSIHIELSRD